MVGVGFEVLFVVVMFDSVINSKKVVVIYDFLLDLVIFDFDLVLEVLFKVLKIIVVDVFFYVIEGYVFLIDNFLMNIFVE